MTKMLLVTTDPKLGASVAERAAADGCELIWCPGPRAPDFTCGASRGGVCPLSCDADVVVIDAWLDSDRAGQGMGSRDLASYYRSRGLPVVVVGGRSHSHA